MPAANSAFDDFDPFSSPTLAPTVAPKVAADNVDSHDPFASQNGAFSDPAAAAYDPFGIGDDDPFAVKATPAESNVSATALTSDDDPFNLAAFSASGDVHVTSSDTTSDPFAVSTETTTAASSSDIDLFGAADPQAPAEQSLTSPSKMSDLAPSQQKALEAQFDDLMGGKYV